MNDPRPTPAATVAVNIRIPIEEWRVMQSAIERDGYRNQTRWIRDVISAKAKEAEQREDAK